MEKKQTEINRQIPDYEALEKLYKEKLEEFERTKKEIVRKFYLMTCHWNFFLSNPASSDCSIIKGCKIFSCT